MSATNRPRPEEAKLDALNALDLNDRAAANEALGKALRDKHYRVVGKAASLAEERLLQERIPDLLAAYARFLQDPVKRDPNCIAKKAIARALVTLECRDTSFYLEGIRYVQLEPVWGGTVDTAADVRGACAMGLVSSGYARAVQELRDFAALALGESRHPLALKHLRERWDDVLVSDEMRAVLIRAAAVHRSDAAFDWLLSIIEDGPKKHAEVAVDALSVYERNTKLTERVKAALAKRSERGGAPSDSR